VIDGVVGIGPVSSEGIQQTVLTFSEKSRTIIGNYSILFKQPVVYTAQATSVDPVDALALPKRPLLKLLDRPEYAELKQELVSEAVRKNTAIK
jgi:hypothetical protein